MNNFVLYSNSETNNDNDHLLDDRLLNDDHICERLDRASFHKF